MSITWRGNFAKVAEWLGFAKTQVRVLRAIGVRHRSLTPVTGVRISIDSLIGHIHIVTSGGLFYLRKAIGGEAPRVGGSTYLNGFNAEEQFYVFGHAEDDATKKAFLDNILANYMGGIETYFQRLAITNYYKFVGVNELVERGYNLQDCSLNLSVFDKNLDVIRSFNFEKKDITTQFHESRGVNIRFPYSALDFRFNSVNDNGGRTFAIVNYISLEMAGLGKKAYYSVGCVVEIKDEDIVKAVSFDMPNHYPFQPLESGGVTYNNVYARVKSYRSDDFALGEEIPASYFNALTQGNDSVYVGGDTSGTQEMALKEGKLYYIVSISQDEALVNQQEGLPFSYIGIDSKGATSQVEGGEIRPGLNSKGREFRFTPVSTAGTANDFSPGGRFVRRQHCLGTVIKLSWELEVEEARGLYSTELYDPFSTTDVDVVYGLTVEVMADDGKVYAVMSNGVGGVAPDSNYICISEWSSDLSDLVSYKLLGRGDKITARTAVSHNDYFYIAGGRLIGSSLRPSVIKLDKQFNVILSKTYEVKNSFYVGYTRSGIERIRVDNGRLILSGTLNTDTVTGGQGAFVMTVSLDDLEVGEAVVQNDDRNTAHTFFDTGRAGEDIIAVGVGGSGENVYSASILKLVDGRFSDSGVVENLNSISVSPLNAEAHQAPLTESTTGLASLYLTDEIRKYAKNETFTRTETTYSTVGGNY